MINRILPPLAGIVLSIAIVIVTEGIGHAVYPPPEGIDFSDREQLAQMVKTLPFGAFAFVLGGWLLGTFAGVALAMRLAKSHAGMAAVIITIVLLSASATNLVMIPHPLWFVVCTVVGVPAVGFLAYRLFAGSGSAESGA